MIFLKKLILKVFYSISKTGFGSHLLRWMVLNMNDILPVNRVRETPALLAIFHPQPSYPFHILLIPKQAKKDISEINVQDQEFLVELFQVVYSIVQEFGLIDKGYRLIVNGGCYQDVELLHFHLISDAKYLY